MNFVKYGTETITFLGAKTWKIFLMTTKSQHPYQRLNPELKIKIEKQTNTLADYAKRLSSVLVLFDWPLLHQINNC